MKFKVGDYINYPGMYGDGSNDGVITMVLDESTVLPGYRVRWSMNKDDSFYTKENIERGYELDKIYYRDKTLKDLLK